MLLGPSPPPYFYYLPHPISYLPNLTYPFIHPLPLLWDPSSHRTHSRPLVPPAEEAKLCSTVVSTNAI